MTSRTLAVALTSFSMLALGCGSDGAGEPTGDDSSSDNGASSDTTGSRSDGSGGANDSGSGGGASAGGGGATTGDGGAAGADSIQPYANVVAVVASETSAGFTFNVSVESSDVDCTQYTDWWEVLSEDGELVYRRILTHSHTNENGTADDLTTADNTFTRSGGPVEVASDQTVVVRAHNSVVGYGGMAMQGSVDQGFADAPDIPSDFAADVEDDDPQVESCAF